MASICSKMAAGRGEFFQNIWRGLEQKSAELPPVPWRVQPGWDERRPGPVGEMVWEDTGQAGARRKNSRPTATRSPVSGSGHSLYPSCSEPTTENKKDDFLNLEVPVSKENWLEKLPLEILMKILSFLDVSSLLCISHVNKLFNQLANDNVLWQKIYTAEFRSHTWRPKMAKDATAKKVMDRSAGHWKKMYFKTMTGQEMDKWRKELRDISPCTGLPRLTECVLRNLNVSWKLTLCDRGGREYTMYHSQAYFFESSVIVRWSGGDLPTYRDVGSIKVHGVRKVTAKSPKTDKPSWCSLMLKLDMRSHPSQFMGRDRLIKLMYVSSGVILGIWRGQETVAFIMVSLHFHRLVERCLLGSPVYPYSEPVNLPPVDPLHPEFILHGFTLHFLLHNPGKIMSGHFCQSSCRTVEDGRVELKFIRTADLSQHRSLSGSITLPWQSETLVGSVENCCIMTLTLLDDSEKPFWCVSSPVCITRSKTSLSLDYGGDHFLMEHQNPGGQVRMKLVWLKEQKQFFVIGLDVYVVVSKRYSRENRR